MLAAAAIATVAWGNQQPAAGQGPAQAYRAPRLAGTPNPDLNGIWQALNTANWDIRPHAAAASHFPQLLGALGAMPAGQGVVEGGEIPYQPWVHSFPTRRSSDLDRKSVV